MCISSTALQTKCVLMLSYTKALQNLCLCKSDQTEQILESVELSTLYRKTTDNSLSSVRFCYHISQAACTHKLDASPPEASASQFCNCSEVRKPCEQESDPFDISGMLLLLLQSKNARFGNRVYIYICM